MELGVSFFFPYPWEWHKRSSESLAQVEPSLRVGARQGRWEIDLEIGMWPRKDSASRMDEYFSFLAGVSFYSYLGSWLRLRHGIRLGVATVRNDPDFRDDDDSSGIPWFEGRLEAITIGFALGKHAWIELMPAGLIYPLGCYLTARIRVEL